MHQPIIPAVTAAVKQAATAQQETTHTEEAEPRRLAESATAVQTPAHKATLTMNRAANSDRAEHTNPETTVPAAAAAGTAAEQAIMKAEAPAAAQAMSALA